MFCDKLVKQRIEYARRGDYSGKKKKGFIGTVYYWVLLIHSVETMEDEKCY